MGMWVENRKCSGRSNWMRAMIEIGYGRERSHHTSGFLRVLKTHADPSKTSYQSMGPIGVGGPWSTLPMTAPVPTPHAATPPLDPPAARDDAFTGVSPEQEHQCLVDLIQRTRNGLLLYPALW